MNSLERQTLLYIGENVDSPDVFLDTDTGIEQIRDSINDAIEEISLLTGSLTCSYPIPLKSDQMFYRLRPQRGSFAWVTSAWLVNQQRSLDQTDIIQLFWFNPRWLDTSAEPDLYFPVGNDVIGFYPRPSSTTDVVDLTVTLVPERYTLDTEPIRILKSFERAVVHYAVSEYWASRGDANEALLEHQKYVSIVGVRSLVPQAAEELVQLKTMKRQQTFRTRETVTRSDAI